MRNGETWRFGDKSTAWPGTFDGIGAGFAPLPGLTAQLKTTISGHLPVGETSTSGWAELVEIDAAPPFFVTPLTNPSGAQVTLALHSHGPAQTGQTRAEQMTSFLGGRLLTRG